jgi:hypothetical protein
VAARSLKWNGAICPEVVLPALQNVVHSNAGTEQAKEARKAMHAIQETLSSQKRILADIEMRKKEIVELNGDDRE